MADEILKCDGTDTVHIPDWYNVVGDATLDNGGYFGDLLEITRAHLEDAKNRGELREEDAGVAYSTAIMDSMKEAIKFELQEGKTKLELCFLQAQIDKLICDCTNDTLLTASKIELNDSQIEVNDAQITKLECDCANDTNMTDSKISLNAAQENKLACECCNDSKRTEGQIVKWECDCANSARVTNAQAELYERQVEGFQDNANQKIYDTQMQAWAMVFADQEDLGVLDASINAASINTSYSRIQERLTAATEDGNIEL